MAKCPLLRKECPETNKGKTGCAWWLDISTDEGVESMCVLIAQYRLAVSQVQETQGVHAAVNSQRNESVKSIAQLSGVLAATSLPTLPIVPILPGDTN